MTTVARSLHAQIDCGRGSVTLTAPPARKPHHAPHWSICPSPTSTWSQARASAWGQGRAPRSASPRKAPCCGQARTPGGVVRACTGLATQLNPNGSPAWASQHPGPSWCLTQFYP